MRLFALALALFVALVAPLAHADSLADLRRRGELTWGGDLQGGAPYVYEDASGEGIRGFEVDIAASLARRLGVRARFVQHDWSNLVPALERGDFDVALNGLEDTPARRERILLSVPYFVYGETLTVERTSNARSLDDLRGKRVGTLNQTVAHDILRVRPVEIVLYEGQQEPYFDLVNGRVDAVLLDHVIADMYGCKLPEARCLPGDVARGTYVVGIPKRSPELKQAIDAALGTMIRDGELEKILRAHGLWDERQNELGVRATTPAAVGTRSFDRAQVRLFLKGAAVTIALSVAAFAIALPFGLVLAVARSYGGTVLRGLSAAYVEIFRGTPVLLQLYVLYFGLAPLVRLGAFEAATLGLGLNYAAYEAEVHRGALGSIPRGQIEVARTLGLAPAQVLRHVVFPQAFRNALPALTNDFVALLKDSSLVSVITVVELTKRMTIAAVDLNDWVTPGLACAALYFVMSFPLARLARRLEKRLAHDSHPRFT
jgi:polar amino acid transport system substrate-binding protein